VVDTKPIILTDADFDAFTEACGIAWERMWIEDMLEEFHLAWAVDEMAKGACAIPWLW
jgi:hypothetical protein